MGEDAENIKAIAQGSIQGAIEGAMKPFNDLLRALLGPSAEETGLLLRDYVTAFRIEKQYSCSIDYAKFSAEPELNLQGFP